MTMVPVGWLINASTAGSPFFSTNLLELSIGRDFGAPKGLSPFWVGPQREKLTKCMDDPSIRNAKQPGAPAKGCVPTSVFASVFETQREEL